jgi:signal transduction histidine kinase
MSTIRHTALAALFVLLGSGSGAGLAAIQIEILDIAFQPEALLLPVGGGGLCGLLLYFGFRHNRRLQARLSRLNRSMREDQAESEKKLTISMDALSKRIKELDCLFGLSRLVETRDISLEEILPGVLDLIPPAWQYPGITCAEIATDTGRFATANYRPTPWQLEKEITANGRPMGRLTVGYLESRPLKDEGPFLEEERRLIDALAERLGRIIERKQAQSELRQSEARLRGLFDTLVENSLTGISIVTDNQVVYQNKEQERLLGPLPRTLILGDYNNIHPDDVDKVRSRVEEISAGAIGSFDVDFRYAPRGDVRNVIWIHCRAHVIEYRQKASILLNMMDMTQIKALETMVRAQDKMASLGRVAAGIAHEIRNPLSGINIYANTLQKFVHKGENEDKIEQVLEHMQSASRKIESVIRRVMDFSKPGEPKFIRTDINPSVEEALKLTSVTLRKSGIKLEKALAENLPAGRLDPQQIEEVVLNLINNAADALRKCSGEKIIRVTSGRNDRSLTVGVIDSGPGISAESRDRVFDPFYTTKSDSTGIGLSICQRIISDHDGRIDVHTSRWGGAEFSISIPIADEPTPDSQSFEGQSP